MLLKHSSKGHMRPKRSQNSASTAGLYAISLIQLCSHRPHDSPQPRAAQGPECHPRKPALCAHPALRDLRHHGVAPTSGLMPTSEPRDLHVSCEDRSLTRLSIQHVELPAARFSAGCCGPTNPCSPFLGPGRVTSPGTTRDAEARRSVPGGVMARGGRRPSGGWGRGWCSWSVGPRPLRLWGRWRGACSLTVSAAGERPAGPTVSHQALPQAPAPAAWVGAAQSRDLKPVPSDRGHTSCHLRTV